MTEGIPWHDDRDAPQRPGPHGDRMIVQQLRLIAFAFMTSPIVIAAIGWAVLFTDSNFPPPTILLVLALITVAVTLICATAPSRLRVIPADTDPAAAFASAVGQFRAMFFTRAALAESVALVSFALGVALAPDAAWTAVIGAALSLGLLLAFALPSRRTVGAAQAALERDGAHTDLTNRLLGEPPAAPPTGSFPGITVH